MDMRYNMPMQDGRRLPPRNSRGEFRRRRSGRRGDRGMDYADMRGDMNYTGGRGGYPMGMRDFGDYESDMARSGVRGSRGGSQGGRSRGGDRGDMGYDMRSDYGYDMARGDRGDMARQDYGYDGHYPQGQMGGYKPVEFMGYCNGYYGMPNQDYGYDMRYDMRGGRDYGYDYGYPYGDFGEVLSEKELEEWCHKLKSQLTEQEKQMFSKEAIMQRAKAMGKPMEGFGEKELEVVVLMLLDDYKKTLGANPDTMIKLAFDWMNDQDSEVKGSEKLALYHDLVSGELD